jgi:hypothetical protein
MSGATIYVDPTTGRPNSTDKSSDISYEEKYGVPISEDYWIGEGQKQGLDRGQRIYGQSYKQTGEQAQDVIKRRQKMLNQPSRASEEIRRSGQMNQRRSRAQGGSDAQQRQIQLDTARMAGLQQDLDYERHLKNQQDMVGSIIRGLTGLEFKSAALENARRPGPPPPKEEGGFFDDLFGWL